MNAFYENKSVNLRAFYSQNFDFPLHLHAHLELIYVLEGCLCITVQQQQALLNAGDCAVVFPNSMHRYQTQGQASRSMTAICGLETAGSYMNTLLKNHPENPFLRSPAIHPDVIYALHALVQEHNAGQSLGVYSAFTQLVLARLLPQLSLVKNKSSDSYDLTYQIAAFIAQNFQRHLSLELLASHLGVSKYHLSRVFSEKMGSSFNDYLNSIRLNYAAGRIRSTKDSMTDICNESGFDSQRTFNRVFKNTYHTTPLKYRDQILQK